MSNVLADYPEGDDWFTEVDYQGAFSKDANWLQGWTYLSEAGYLAAAPQSSGEVVNVSARATLAEGQSLIPGFTVLGTQTVLIRAVGPKLADFGVTTATVADPIMTLFKADFVNGGQIEVASADNWDEDNGGAAVVAAANQAGLFPFTAGEFQSADRPTVDTTSAAALVTLTEGVYTVVATSADGSAGEILVDVTVVE